MFAGGRDGPYRKPLLGKAQAIIQLTGSRLIVARCEGRSVAAWTSAWLPPRRADQTGDAWAWVLNTAATPLSEAVAKLHLRGARATMFVRSVGESFSASIKPAEGADVSDAEFAELALAEQAEFPIADNPWAFAALGGAGASAARAIVAAADSDEHVSAAQSLARRCGLGTTRVLSSRAAAALETARAALAGSNAGPAAVLWFGESASLLVVASRGQLKLIRPISVGLEALVEPLTRPIRRRGADADAAPITLDRARAWELLLRHGVPQPQTVLDPGTGLDGQALLPLMAPVIQTLAVELKQTVRFGLAESERATVTVDVGGPGGGLANLCSTLGRQCGLTLRPAEGLGTALPEQADGDGASAGACVAWHAPGVEGMELVTRAACDARSARRARHAVMAGVAIAAAGVVWSWMSTTGQLVAERATLAQLGQEALAAEDRARLAGTLKAAQTALAEARSQLSSQLAPVIDAAALLEAVSASMPESARVARLSLSSLNGRPVLMITGWMPETPDGDFPAALRGITDKLAAVPMVSGVKLGPTGRSRERGEPAQRFELTLNLVGLAGEWLARRELPATGSPATAQAPAQASAGTGGQQ